MDFSLLFLIFLKCLKVISKSLIDSTLSQFLVTAGLIQINQPQFFQSKENTIMMINGLDFVYVLNPILHDLKNNFTTRAGAFLSISNKYIKVL